jgi:hypothetical protein
MRVAAFPLFVALAPVTEIAFAEEVRDPLGQVRACSLMKRAERLECLDKLSRSITPPAPATGNWTVSETTSPVDYTPIVVAITHSGEGDDITQLTIYCRGGRTELVVAGLGVPGGRQDYALTYRINGNEPVQTGAGAPSFGTGAALKGDVVRLLQSLPERGDISVRVVPRAGSIHEGHFSLGGLNAVRVKLASACKWPQAAAKPRN